MTRRRGFTLVEVLTVAIIISTLSVIALPRIRDAVYRAKAVDLLSRVRAVQTALATVTITPDELRAPPGEVPPGLEKILSASTLVSPDGIKVGFMAPNPGAGLPDGPLIIVVTSGANAAQQRILYLLHKLEADQHLYSMMALIVPVTRTPCTHPSANGCSTGTP